MKFQIKRYAVVLMSLISAFTFLLAIAFMLPRAQEFAAAEGNEMTVSSITADPNSKFANASYLSTFKIRADEIAEYYANGGERDNYPLSNAFDAADKTYWISREGNSETFKNHLVKNSPRRWIFSISAFPARIIRPTTRVISAAIPRF